MIRRDLRDLPEPGKPDPEPRFAPVLAEKWRAENEAEYAAHVPSGKPFRHSDGGTCARAIAYRAAHIPQSDPMDLTGHVNVTLGKWIHEQWQAGLVEKYGAKATVEAECAIAAVDSIGYIDALVDDEKLTAIEAKSIGGYGFKSAVGAVRRGTPPEGPKWGHIVQASLNALAVNADEAAVTYLPKEAISYADWAEVDRICAEWTYPRDEYEPIARQEVERVQGILALLAEGELAARKIPGVKGEIVNASKGEWRQFDKDDVLLDTGTTWECRYCNWQTVCSQTPPGRVPVEQVVEISRKAA